MKEPSFWVAVRPEHIQGCLRVETYKEAVFDAKTMVQEEGGVVYILACHSIASVGEVVVERVREDAPMELTTLNQRAEGGDAD